MDRQYVISELIDILALMEKDRWDKALHKLRELGVHKLYNYLGNVVELDKMDQEVLELLIKALQEIYNNSIELPPLTDEQYDKLYARLNGFGNDIVGARVNNGTTRLMRQHQYPDLRGSLDKIHFLTREQKGSDNRKCFEEWLESAESKLGRDLTNEFVYIMPKFDGVSIILEIGNEDSNENLIALTRGDVEKNEASECPLFNNIVMDGSIADDRKWDKYGVKTEVVVTTEQFEMLKKDHGDFKSQRSAASAIINAKEVDRGMMKYLTIIPLMVQDFDTKEIITPKVFIEHRDVTLASINTFRNNPGAILKIFDLIKENCLKAGTPIDGAVIRFVDKDIAKELGREYHINKYEVAYKFPAEFKKTTLDDIEFSIGILGGVTPVAKIKPVVLKGNKIKSISLGSMDRFMELGLRKGDEVIVKYDIIPYLDIDDTCKVNESAIPIPPIAHCPFCQQLLIEDPILKCVNNSCPSRQVGKILNYVNKMGIMNIDEGIITTLFKEGVLKTIQDLYSLEDHTKEMVAIDGFGTKSVKNIIEGVAARKKVRDYELLGSIGIADIGRRMFKKILDIHHIDDLETIAEEGLEDALTNIVGIKSKTAQKIIKGINENKELIRFLRSKLEVSEDHESKMIVCFTKIRDKEFEKFLGNQGITVVDSVIKELNCLIVESRETESSKTKKATKLGIPILTLDEAYTLFKYNFIQVTTF